MFSITGREVQKSTPKAIVKLLEQFDDDIEVWKGDSGDWLIGDADELDEDDVVAYSLLGTVASLLAEYKDLVAAVED